MNSLNAYISARIRAKNLSVWTTSSPQLEGTLYFRGGDHKAKEHLKTERMLLRHVRRWGTVCVADRLASEELASQRRPSGPLASRLKRKLAQLGKVAKWQFHLHYISTPHILLPLRQSLALKALEAHHNKQLAAMLEHCCAERAITYKFCHITGGGRTDGIGLILSASLPQVLLRVRQRFRCFKNLTLMPGEALSKIRVVMTLTVSGSMQFFDKLDVVYRLPQATKVPSPVPCPCLLPTCPVSSPCPFGLTPYCAPYTLSSPAPLSPPPLPTVQLCPVLRKGPVFLHVQGSPQQESASQVRALGQQDSASLRRRGCINLVPNFNLVPNVVQPHKTWV